MIGIEVISPLLFIDSAVDYDNKMMIFDFEPLITEVGFF